MPTDAQEKCAMAGMLLAREHESFKKATPTIWPGTNLKGLVKEEDWKVPPSELAMHIGAADKEVVAFSLVGRSSALVIYDDGKGGCSYTFGTQHEVLSKPLWEKASEMFEKRGPD